MPGDSESNVAGVLVANIVGYSRLMGEDEAGTARAVREHRDGTSENRANGRFPQGGLQDAAGLARPRRAYEGRQRASFRPPDAMRTRGASRRNGSSDAAIAPNESRRGA